MIFLTILKIIGWILLALFCLLLLLMALVLLCAIRYEAEVEKREDISGYAKVRWLWGILKVEVTFEDGLRTNIRIFGHVFGKKKQEAQPEAFDLQTAEYQPPEAELPPQTEVPKLQKMLPSKPMEGKAETPKFHEPPPAKAIGAGEVRRISLAEIVEEPPQEEPKAEEKTEKLDFDYFKNMPMAEKKELISITFGLLKKVLKHVKPKQVRIRGVIGTGEVELTGYVLALCGMLTGFLGDSLQIKGNFKEAMLVGDIALAGRIRMGTLAGAVFSAAVKKPVRKLIKLAWKGKGEKHGK